MYEYNHGRNNTMEHNGSNRPPPFSTYPSNMNIYVEPKISYWGRRTRLEKRLLILSVIAVSCAIFFSTVFICASLQIVKYSKLLGPFRSLKVKFLGIIGKEMKDINLDKVLEEIKKRNVCLTPGCVQAASHVMEYIDPKVNPCDSFYDFTCGKWMEDHHIKDDRTAVSSFSKVVDGNEEKLKVILETESKDDPFYVQNARVLYKACMNTTRIDERKDEPIRRILKLLGGWPMIDDIYVEGKMTFMNIIELLVDMGLGTGHLFSVGPSIDKHNNSRRLISFFPARLSLAREYWVEENKLSIKRRSAYRTLFKDVAIMMGADNKTVDGEIDSVMALERKLGNLTLSREKSRNFSEYIQTMTFGKFAQETPTILWQEITEIIMKEKVKKNQLVQVSQIGYFKGLEILLNETNPRIITNYFLWRTVKSVSSLLSYDFQKPFRRYKMSVSSVYSEPPRWRTCFSAARVQFRIATAYAFVKNHFDPINKRYVKKIIQYIMKESSEQIKKSKWMDPVTKVRALEKAENMAFEIGYPKELLDDRLLAKYYEKFQLFEGSDYFETVLRINFFFYQKILAEWKDPVDRFDWKGVAGYMMDTNAYHSMMKNMIIFPAGFLHEPFYNKEFPNYMNFGSLGYVIGHEIFHGFDDMGRQFDHHGNNSNWWQEATSVEFKKKAQCFIDQYSNQSVVGRDGTRHHLRGINLQGENIADNGGMRQSLLAYRRMVNETGSELRLPSLNYDPEQLFWISFGKTFCQKIRPQIEINSVITGVHTPARHRVEEVVKNSKEFSKAFKCPIGSNMNPVNKCHLW